MAVAKALVIVMSFLIAVLMGLIIYGFYQKSQNPNYKMFRADDTPIAQTDATPAQPDLRQGFGRVALDLTDAARIVSAQATGDRLVLVIARNGENPDLVVVMDMVSGKVLGRVKTAP